MIKILMPLLAIITSASFAADRYGNDYNADVYRSAAFRAPTLPVAATLPIPSTIPGTTSPAPTPTPQTVVSVAPAPTYSVDNCMNDISICVENTLPDGIKAMFNSDLRNSITNGMNLCGTQIDKCINDTKRLDGRKAYYAKNDVWIDFNSRIVQPQYYTEVLVKTGLTPNQAENTCLLLDRNAYGESFGAVSKSGAVTTEYNHAVTPYNNQGGEKSNSMGSVVNTKGDVDAKRGHYARWDASNGDCLVRVAAYNQDQLISNEWFGGAIGDKAPAEHWVSAGSSFGCNKDLFGQDLMNNTKTAALATGIAIGGGALVGAGVGAIVTLDQVDNTALVDVNCDNGNFRQLLSRALGALNVDRANSATTLQGCQAVVEQYPTRQINLTTIKAYLDDKEKGKPSIDCANWQSVKDALARLGTNDNITDQASCQAIIASYSKKVNIGSDMNATIQAKMDEMNIGKGAGAGIGAAVGAGTALVAGGIATAITAFVESNNILCHIGDNLDSVGFGKTGRVSSLKEYYVKWALKLPDTVQPTQTVTECNSWNTACNSINNIADCAMATIIYKPQTATRSTQVETACVVSGNTCVANQPIAVSYGACM